MKHLPLLLIINITLLNTNLFAQNSDALQNDLLLLKQQYELNIKKLEQRLSTIESQTNSTVATTQNINTNTNNNSFNPAISLILDGKFTHYDNNPEDYAINGFPLEGEAGLAEQGFSIGHTELVASANIDDKFYGKFTVAIAEHDGETELEIEEAFAQTLGLGYGLTAKAGRFFSAIGYLNEQHEHAWDFADAPLVYNALFANKLLDDGIQISLVAPTDLFIELGAEAFSARRYSPAADHSGIGMWTAFTHIGGDIGVSHSWQLGISHWQGDAQDRQTDAHAHEENGPEEIPSFTGNSKLNALDFIYKWAPNGNATNTNITVQLEYFARTASGDITLINSDPIETSQYDGDVNGWYTQLTYKFKRHWRTAIRYDYLDNNNQGTDTDVLAEAGLLNDANKPTRVSLMAEWTPSEFSRIRLQYNHDDASQNTDQQWILQYTFSLGAHGAHQF